MTPFDALLQAAKECLTFAQVASLAPKSRLGRPATPTTIWQWVHKGVRTPDGRVVHLEAARVAGRWVTSEAALRRFLAEQQAPADQVERTPTPENDGRSE